MKTFPIQEPRPEDETFDTENKFLAMAETLPVTVALLASYTYYFWFC
jgi:hypothetical protein